MTRNSTWLRKDNTRQKVATLAVVSSITHNNIEMFSFYSDNGKSTVGKDTVGIAEPLIVGIVTLHQVALVTLHHDVTFFSSVDVKLHLFFLF